MSEKFYSYQKLMEGAFAQTQEQPNLELSDFMNPFKIAQTILVFLKTRNLKGLLTVLNDANKTILREGRSKKYIREWERRLERTAKMFERVEKITEFREIARNDSENLFAIAAKVKQHEHLMYAITLTKQKEGFFFDDLIAPHVLEYQQWKPFLESQQSSAVEE